MAPESKQRQVHKTQPEASWNILLKISYRSTGDVFVPMVVLDTGLLSYTG